MREKKLAPNDPLVAQSLTDLGDCLIQENRGGEAEPMLRRALAIDRKNQDPAGIESRGYLARILARRGNYPEAIALLRESLDILRRTQGTDSPDFLLTMHNLSGALIDYSGDLVDAEASERQVLEVRRRISPDHPDTAYSLSSLSWILLEEGNWQAAEPFLKQTLEMTRDLGKGSDRFAVAQNNWAHLLQEKGDYAGAKATYDEAFKTMQEVNGTNSWQAARVRINLGQLKFDRGDYSGAEHDFTEILSLVRKLGGDDHPQVAALLVAVAEAKMFQGQSAAAEPLLRQALSIRKRKLDPSHTAIISAEVRLGEALTAQGRSAEAEPLLRHALGSARSSSFPLMPWQVGEAEGALGECLFTLGHEPEADQLLRQSRGDLEHHPRPGFVNAHLRFRDPR